METNTPPQTTINETPLPNRQLFPKNANSSQKEKSLGERIASDKGCKNVLETITNGSNYAGYSSDEDSGDEQVNEASPKETGPYHHDSATHLSLSLYGEEIKAFLAAVPINLQLRAAMYGIEIHEDDLAFLYNNDGEFMPEVEANRLPSHMCVTAHKYCTHLRHFWNFCALCGEYDSMFMLLSNPPEYCPPVDPYVVCAYISYRFSKQGSVVMKQNSPVYAVLLQGVPGQLDLYPPSSQILLSRGDHSSPDNACQLTAPLIQIHNKHRNNKVQFCDRCEGCYKKHTEATETVLEEISTCLEEGSDGISINAICQKVRDACNGLKCDRHQVGDTSHSPTNIGNAFPHSDKKPDQTHHAIKELKSEIKVIMKARKPKKRRRMPLLPSNVKKIHDDLLEPQGKSKGLLEEKNMRYLTMIMLSIYTGCRFDGMFNLKWGDANEVTHAGEYTVNKGITGVGVRLQEKFDKEPYTFAIPMEDHHPYFCFARHFLIYIHCFHHPETWDNGGLWTQPPDGMSLAEYKKTNVYRSALKKHNRKKIFSWEKFVPRTGRSNKRRRSNESTAIPVQEPPHLSEFQEAQHELDLQRKEKNSARNRFTKWLKDMVKDHPDLVDFIDKIGGHSFRRTFEYKYKLFGDEATNTTYKREYEEYK